MAQYHRPSVIASYNVPSLLDTVAGNFCSVGNIC